MLVSFLEVLVFLLPKSVSDDPGNVFFALMIRKTLGSIVRDQNINSSLSALTRNAHKQIVIRRQLFAVSRASLPIKTQEKIIIRIQLPWRYLVRKMHERTSQVLCYRSLVCPETDVKIIPLVPKLAYS